MVFLCETRQKAEKVKRLRGRLGLRGFTGVDSDGLSGGLALFWCDQIKVEVQSQSERFIDVHVQLSDNEPAWRLTCVYGEPRAENRHNMWSIMRNLKTPWCVMGDFNEAMWPFEHFSATKRFETHMLAFRDMLETCELVDLGFSGLPYTYDNKRRGRANVKVRLDRVVADNRWRNLFADAKVEHKVSPCSDHCPIVLKCAKDEMTPRPNYRRYEVMWEREASLPEHISNAWAAAGPKVDLAQIRAGLADVMKYLQKWSKDKFGSVKIQLEKSRNLLEELQNMDADREEIRAVADQMNELLYREEMMWMQRIDWLKEGDRNTKIFHSKAVWRARKNKVKVLIDDMGNEHTDHAMMGKLVNEYFEGLFTSDDSLDPNLILPLIETKVTPEMNDKLLLEFSDKEISYALFQIGPLKAPGPDGFPARFFQRNWGVLKDEIIPAVKEFFRNGVMPAGVNDATIVLIPKVDNPTKVTEFRPISLCNIIYKVIAKCLVNRLRPILEEIVSPNQSAFVPGRLITDNALVAFECFHYIQQEKDPEKSFCAYKLDLSKAYDRVDWRFLEQMMQKIGFDHRWVKWIMTCVTSVRYAVKFNGAILDSFAPSRGLRQGDPLSPFLFLFIADGLSALLRQGIQQQVVTPVKICARAPGVSHLLFADDTLLFFKATLAKIGTAARRASM
jgi:hypothetical protein